MEKISTHIIRGKGGMGTGTRGPDFHSGRASASRTIRPGIQRTGSC